MSFVANRPLRQFFPTIPVRCPYLAGQEERKLVVDLAGPDARSFYADLSRAGFRRSHGLAYRPACRACTACVPVRIRVDGFVPGRSLRRVARQTSDLVERIRPPRATAEQYRLFRRYQQARHPDGEMATMTFGDYRAMVEDTPVDTLLLELRDRRHTLVAAVLADRIVDGLSAVYSFFDPDQPQRSLGTSVILRLVARAQARGLPFVYLGYWIAGSETMDYKRRFPGVEGLVGGVWRPGLAPRPEAGAGLACGGQRKRRG